VDYLGIRDRGNKVEEEYLDMIREYGNHMEILFYI
jgi:hypothetical protein